MSKVVILQRDIPVWTKSTWVQCLEIMPRIERFCSDRFGIYWDYWSPSDDEVHHPAPLQIPHAIRFERDEDATIFILSFK
jgi:hypothetical protein